jgi:hypothetical protein
MDERGVDCDGTRALDAHAGCQVGDSLKRFDEFRSAIRVAALVDCIDTDEDVVGTQDLGPHQGDVIAGTAALAPVLSIGRELYMG